MAIENPVWHHRSMASASSDDLLMAIWKAWLQKLRMNWEVFATVAKSDIEDARLEF